MSAGPYSRSVCWRRRSTASKRVQSALTPIAWPPASTIPVTTWSMACWSRPLTTTRARFAASMRQVAAPIPREPPVTTATFPARSG